MDEVCCDVEVGDDKAVEGHEATHLRSDHFVCLASVGGGVYYPADDRQSGVFFGQSLETLGPSRWGPNRGAKSLPGAKSPLLTKPESLLRNPGSG